MIRFDEMHVRTDNKPEQPKEKEKEVQIKTFKRYLDVEKKLIAFGY
jgi:hypothetical protein